MTTKIFKSYCEFLNREDKSINGVSPAFAEDFPYYEKDNETNTGCWNCAYCRYCKDCSYCRDCSSCIDRSYCSSCSYENEESPKIPVIDDIHKKVYEAASQCGALDMSEWHCGTSHCRAGWVVHLAGCEGYKLEEFHNTALAAQLIYRESGFKINPAMFFVSNKEALKDMKKLAEGEG